MAKLTLEIDEDYDFDLIGICSHIKDYRLSWEINRQLGFDLIKDKNFELHYQGEKQSHAFYSYLDEENAVEYFLINNRSESGLLIPEENKCDYFFIVKGMFNEKDKKALMQKIAEMKHVLTTYEIEVESLKSKNNLLF